MAHKFIIDNRSGQLYTDFSGRRVTTAAEILKGERGLSPTLEIYAINVATDTRAVTSETINNSNVSVAIGEAGAVPDKGLIKAQWSVGGSLYESTELDIENLTADSLASAFNNAVYPVYNAGGLDVAQIGAGKFLLTLKTNGAIDGLPSLNVEAVDPPAGVEVTTIRTGDSDTKAQYLISLAKLPVAKIASGSWSSATDGSFSGLSASISLNTTAMLAAISRGQREFEISITNSNQVLHRSTVIINESLDPTASGTIIVTSVPISSYLQTNGGTMSGAIAMGSNKITGLADGVASGDAATKGQLDALIDGSPDNLNTLNELAAALNDDENFSTTVTNNIATKLPKDGSQAMTGALQLITGSAASPALTFSSDTDTGIFYESGLVSFSINGTKKAYVSTAGVTSEANVYHSSTGSFRGYGYDAVISTNSGYGIVFKPNDSIFGKFTSAGNLGLGSDFAADKTLVVRAADAEIVIDDIDSTDTPRLRFRESGTTSGSIETDASNLIFRTGLDEAARFDSSGHFLIPDDNKIKLGDDADLEIYNAANSNSVIKKTNLGGLFILNNSTTYIQGTFGEDMARFIKDGANEFYYDGSKKLETISEGCQITGSLGIGGTPVVELDVQGDMMVTNTAPRFILKESGSAKDICFKVQTDGRLSIFDDNQVNEIVTVKQDGKVGFGGLPLAQTYIESNNNSFAATGTPSNYHLVLRNPQNDLTEGVGIGFTSSTGTDSIGAAIAFERTGNQAQGDLVFSAKSSTSAGASLDELMRLDGSTGKVGINTSSPTKTLTVKGTILKTRSDSDLGLIFLDNDGSQNGNISINQNDGTTRVKINSDGDSYFNGGNLSVGTTSPSVSLHVKKDSSSLGPVLRLDNGSTSDLSQSGIQFVNTSTGVPRSAIYSQRVDSGYNSELIFYTSDTDTLQERLRIDHDGHIRQNFINYTDASNYEALKISAESDHIKFDAESVGSFSSNARDIRFAVKGTQRGQITEAGVWTYYNYYISGSGSLRNYGNTLKLTTGGGDYDIEFNPNDTTRMILKSDTGRLGVNNTNPQKTIDVTGDIRASTNVFASNNVYAAFKYVFGSSTSEGEYIERSSSDLDFYAGGGNRFTVEASGDCEILDDGKGLILSSPDGTRYKITVANDGAVTSTAM